MSIGKVWVGLASYNDVGWMSQDGSVGHNGRSVCHMLWLYRLG